MHYMPYSKAFVIKPWMEENINDSIDSSNATISPYNTVNLSKTTEFSEQEISCNKILDHLNNCSNCQLKLADQIANNTSTSVKNKMSEIVNLQETPQVSNAHLVSNVIEKFSNFNSKNTIDTIIVFCLLLITLWVFVITKQT